MKSTAKFALGAALAGGIAVAAVAPADAGIAIGIGIGAPGPYYHPHGWCYYHPYRCNPPAYYGGPVYSDGYFVVGRGYWHEHGWWGHRGWYGRHWRYWR